MFKFKKLISMFVLFLICCNLISAKETEFKEEIYKNNEKIRELNESEIQINEEIANLERQLLNIAEEINSKQNIIDDYTKTIEEYENKIHDLNKNIETLNGEISSIEAEVSKNIDEINMLEEEVEKFKDVISKRLRNLYMHIDTYNPLIKIFYTSENVLDLNDKIVNISKFIELDKSIIEKVLKNIDDIKVKNENIESLKKLIQDKMKLINEKISENDENLSLLEIQKELKQKEVDEINQLSNELKTQYDNLSDEKKMIQEEIIKIYQDNHKLQEEIKKYLEKLNEDNKSVNSKVNYGKYLKPAQGKITSKYGKRTHPITGKESFHTGIDIAGSTGNNIIASLSGKVVSSGWYNSVYGNVIIINHGNNIQTFYAHLDKTLVKKGQDVKAGDVVGKMGSTGLSTGPHLHFEIRINGEHVDPLKRIKS